MSRIEIIQDTGYGMIPRRIMRDSSLSIQAKAIYSYLASFAGNTGKSFPSTDLMTNELNLSRNTLFKYLKELREQGVITVKRERSKGGKFDKNIYYLHNKIGESLPCTKFPDMDKPDMDKPDMDKPDMEKVDTNSNNTTSNNINNKYIGKYVEKEPEKLKERRIYIQPCIKENFNTPIKEKFNTYETKVNQGTKENFKDNSTSINNTNNKYISKYVEKESEKLKEISKLYQENIGVINGIVAEELLLISEEIDPALFKEAIKIATDKSKCNFGYVKGILNQWKKNNIKTLTDLEALRVQKTNISKNSNKEKGDNYAGTKSNTKKNEKSVQEKVKELLERKGKTFKDYL